MTSTLPAQIHASCVSMDGAGVLLRGPSGSGKSDLALRLIDRGAHLVADDRVDLSAGDAAVMASAPPALSGLLEVRGVGILTFPAAEETPVRLVVDLVAADAVERIPDDATVAIAGFPVAAVCLDAFAASAVMKVRLALDLALGRIIRFDD